MTQHLADARLRLESSDQQDEARRDFMFLRWLRTGLDGAAMAIGWLFNAAVCGGDYLAGQYRPDRMGGHALIAVDSVRHQFTDLITIALAVDEVGNQRATGALHSRHKHR